MRLPVLFGSAAMLVCWAASVQPQTAPAKPDLPLVAARSLNLDIDEGSWISLDVSPDGRSIIFDLLGDLYTLPVTGGTATQVRRGMM